MSRTTIFFLIILVTAMAARLAYRWYHGNERASRRRLSRENTAYRERKAENDAREDRKS
jgi:uncharacterized membrane protein YidH (DUF202 family)